MMMKIAFIPVLLVATTAHAVNVSSEIVIPVCPSDMQAQKSSRLVQITAHASPLKGTKIDFYSYKLDSHLSHEPTLTLSSSFITDEKGRIKTPELSPGEYCVTASGPDKQFAQFLISVVPGKKARTTNFTLHLVSPPGPSLPPLSHSQWTPADEQIPIQKHVSAFRGTVTAPSGAVIPDASIGIVKKGTEGKKHVAQLKTGPDGRFSGELPARALYRLLLCALFQGPDHSV